MKKFILITSVVLVTLFSTVTLQGQSRVNGVWTDWVVAILSLGSTSTGATLTQIKSGSGDPEGSVTAPAGSLYLRTEGTVYKKGSGAGNTGWVELEAGAGTGDITAVTAGAGLTGGASSGAATLDIGAGTYIDVAADAVSVDLTEIAGSVTFGDGSTNTIVWTFDRLSGTDPTMTFNNGSIGLQALTLTTALAATSGGTGLSSLPSDDQIIVSNGSAFQAKSIPDCDDSGGQHLNYDTTTNAFSCGTTGDGGGGGGAVATDAIWDAAGDLAVGTGANTAARLAMGTALQYLRVNAGATALEWATFTTLQSTDIDTCSEFAAIMAGETGTCGSLVLSTAPTFTTSIAVGSAGVRLSDDGDGALTFLGLGNGSDEDFTINLDDVADTATISSSTGLTSFTFSSIDVIVPTEVYNATNWNGDNSVPTKDAVRDILESFLTLTDPNLDCVLEFDDSGNAIECVENATFLAAVNALTGSIDHGGLTSFEIPNGAAPTVDAVGEVAVDNDYWAASHGALAFFDGTTALYLCGTSDTPTNGQVVKWNTGGTCSWENDSTGSGSLGSNLTSTTNDITSNNNALKFVANSEDLSFTASSNTWTLGTSTGVTAFNFGGIALRNAGLIGVSQYLLGVCQGSTASLGVNLQASGAATVACDGSTIIGAVVTFPDSGTSEVQGVWRIPDDWDGAAMTFKGKWFANTTNTGLEARWQFSGVCAGNGDARPTAYNSTAANTDDSALGTANRLNDFSITLGVAANDPLDGCAAGETLYFRFFRDPSADDLTLDAKTDAPVAFNYGKL